MERYPTRKKGGNYMSVYESTVDMLSLLSEDDLKAVNSVVRRFAYREVEEKRQFL